MPNIPFHTLSTKLWLCTQRIHQYWPSSVWTFQFPSPLHQASIARIWPETTIRRIEPKRNYLKFKATPCQPTVATSVYLQILDAKGSDRCLIDVDPMFLLYGMAWSNFNITLLLCGESIGHPNIPHRKDRKCGALMISVIVNNQLKWYGTP